jgi:Fe-Mn family superoxide dismutase
MNEVTTMNAATAAAPNRIIPREHFDPRAAEFRRNKALRFEVAPLPYKKHALEPLMSENTVEWHYEKHHKGYMTALKELIEGTSKADCSLEEIIKTSSGRVFNNAAQVWNHTFFWQSMSPRGGGPPGRGELLDIINGDFGGWDRFCKAFVDEGLNRFGSGWVWFIVDGGKGKIVSTSNAETVLTTVERPLIVCDVWEHAYYLDYKSNRKSFLEGFCKSLVNWDFAAANLKR